MNNIIFYNIIQLTWGSCSGNGEGQSGKVAELIEGAGEYAEHHPPEGRNPRLVSKLQCG
jgi:hypothetical protein